MRKQGSQSPSRNRKGVKAKRQVYADLRYLVSLETLAKKVKIPFIQRASWNFIENDKPIPMGLPVTLSDPAVEPNPQNGGVAAPAECGRNLRNVLLVVDQRLNMYYGSRLKMKSVVAAEAAALIAWHAFAQKDGVGAITFSDNEAAVLSPYCSRVQIMLILHDLLNQNHRLSSNTDRRSSPGMLNHALRRAAAIARANFQIVLITDGSGQDQETGRLLQSISAHNDLAVLLVYDPRQIECSDENRYNGRDRMIVRRDLKRSCSFSDGTLTIPLNNQVEVADQFRRGFRKLLQLKRILGKQQAPTQGDSYVQTGAPVGTGDNGTTTAASRFPSTLGTSQSICAQLNSR
jgi:hypothetical protein